MTATTKFTLTETQADALIAETGTSFRGRSVSRIDATTVEFYGSKGDTSAFADVVARHKRGGVSATDAATPRQVAYLRELLRTENGRASGLTDARITPSLTKAEASRMINTITGWA